MSPSSNNSRSNVPRETELAREESELSSMESRLAEQASRAAQEAQALASRLTQVRTELKRAESEHSEDVTIPEIGARLQAAAIPELAVDAAREKALSAREQALEVRRQATQEVTIALHAFQQQTTALTKELAEAEARLKEIAEAAARARREQEAARAREAARAKAAAKPQFSPRAAAAAAAAASVTEPNLRSPAQREHTRVNLKTNINLGSDSNFFTGFSTDISEGGVFVATVETVPRGTKVDLDLVLPGGRPLRASGVVRWLREPNDHTPDLMPGVGVQFQELQPEVASLITDFVRKREPLFYPD